MNTLNDKFSIQEVTDIFDVVKNSKPRTKINEVTNLVFEAQKAKDEQPGTALKELITQIGDTQNIKKTTSLIKTSLKIGPKGVTLAKLKEYVRDMPAGTEPNKTLTDLFKALGKKAGADETGSLIRVAATKLETIENADFLALLKRNSKRFNDTATRVRKHVSAIDELNANDAASHVQRFEDMVGRISRFANRKANNGGNLNSPPNNIGTIYYLDNGTKGNSNNYTFYVPQHRWNHFSQRHTYEYFSFSADNIDDNNTMWPLGSNAQNKFDNYIAQATANGLGDHLTGKRNPQDFHQVSVGANDAVFGVKKNGRISQFYPDSNGTLKDFSFTKNEIKAINNIY